MQPRTEGLIRQESVKRFVCVQERFLHCILGVLMIHHNRSRHSIGAPLVRSNQLRERLSLAALRGEYEISLVRWTVRHGPAAGRV